jgi:hypothetical protein
MPKSRSQQQEWDWPPEGRFREERYVAAVPRRTGWASPAASKFTSGYLRFVVLILKVMVGAVCGLGIVLCLLVIKALIGAI